jgi:hypothetical protein
MSNPEIARTKVEIFIVKHSVDFEIACHTVSDLRGYNGDIHTHWEGMLSRQGFTFSLIQRVVEFIILE